VPLCVRLWPAAKTERPYSMKIEMMLMLVRDVGYGGQHHRVKVAAGAARYRLGLVPVE